MSTVPPPPPPPPPAYQPPAYAPAAPSFTYAGFWSRVAARLIDGLIGLLFSLPGLAFIIAAATQTEDDVNGDTEFTDAGVALLVIGLVLLLIGSVIFLILWMRKLGRGQSWGQKAVGISLVAKDTGRPIGGGRAFLRYIVASLISGALFGLGYLWMLWDRDKQCWHDKIMSTVVVEA
ncbi:MAG TPA: RDD family protein [Acidimicrobiales bacterium]|jgi:uncharacterized RDD family membrane protein YckC|nr:RDD family protein [Acidimicrobiales bacterium]